MANEILENENNITCTEEDSSSTDDDLESILTDLKSCNDMLLISNISTNSIIAIVEKEAKEALLLAA